MALKSISSLYLHWCNADTIRQFITMPLPQKAHGDLDAKVAAKLLETIETHSTFTRLQVWYALLYVVVEGYQELGDKDDEIDKLLLDVDIVADMKRFRNAVFHPQEDPLSDKVLNFLVRPGSEVWPRQLNTAFERYFDNRLQVRGLVREILNSELNR